MTGINWQDLVAKAGPVKVEEYAPKKAKAPVITWSMCKCDKNHKSAETFLKCSVGKQYVYNGRNAHLKRPYIDGTGSWAVISERWSETYYSTHNNSQNDLSHLQVFISLYETFEEASDIYLAVKEGRKTLARDSELYKAVVKVAF
jgi:hypothetical protein